VVATPPGQPERAYRATTGKIQIEPPGWGFLSFIFPLQLRDKNPHGMGHPVSPAPKKGRFH